MKRILERSTEIGKYSLTDKKSKAEKGEISPGGSNDVSGMERVYLEPEMRLLQIQNKVVRS